MRKRGISPLIATVLIIGFTIALAAIVITWGGGFVRSTTEGTGEEAIKQISGLTDIDIEISKISVVSGLLGVNVVNNGEKDVEGFIVKVHGETTGVGRIDEKVPGYGGGSFLVGIDNMPKKVDKVELFPIILQDGETYVSKSGFFKKNVVSGFEHKDMGLYMNFDSGSTNLITGMVAIDQCMEGFPCDGGDCFDGSCVDGVCSCSGDVVDDGEEPVDSIKDLSGNGNDGSASGEVLLVDGLVGKAIEIHNSGTHTPSDSYNHVSASNVVMPSGSSFSVSALVNADSWPDSYNNVVNEYVYFSATDQRGFILGRQSNRMFYVFGGTSGNCKINASPPSADEWHHIVGTFKRGEIKYYVDGVETGTQEGNCDFDYKASTKPLRIGARAGENRWGFNGKIDEVIVVNRVLSAEEVAGMYNHLI